MFVSLGWGHVTLRTPILCYSKCQILDIQSLHKALKIRIGIDFRFQRLALKSANVVSIRQLLFWLDIRLKYLLLMYSLH